MSQKRSSKQIAQRYLGNLSYYKDNHYFRALKKRIGWICVIATLAIALLAFFIERANLPGKQLVEDFYNPGPISDHHAYFEKDCDKCHKDSSVVQLTVASTPMDAGCVECHTSHTFHQPTDLRDHSCAACHHEHMGKGTMQPVADANCASCHNSSAVMQAAAEEGKTIPEHDFPAPKQDGATYFYPKRPEEGYTTTFASFEKGHPNFQLHREKLSDPTPLKFNHKVHLTGDIPQIEGKKLDCDYCHQPDPTGAYMQPINYERNCQACHSLQLDPKNPDLRIPHGNLVAVRNFIRAIPEQYNDFGKAKGLKGPQLEAFVQEQMQGLRRFVRQGVNLESHVFFNTGEVGPVRTITSAPRPTSRVRYAGCNYCHDVTTNNIGPNIIPPNIPDRWLSRSKFDHRQHILQLNCRECHDVEKSEKTSDILIPAISNCLDCHNTEHKVTSSCQACHDYHEVPHHEASKSKIVASSTQVSLKEMMLAQSPEATASAE